MNKLTEQRLRRKIRQIIREEREYQLRQLSPGAYSALSADTLGIPPSAVIDVKIIKAPKPIFKCFLDNGQTFNLIDNGEYMQADINRILFDLDRDDDINGAKYELEKLMQKGKPASDDEETADAGADNIGGDVGGDEPTAEEPADEPAADADTEI